MDEKKVLIVGAGIAGLSAAIALEKKGIPYKIIEKHPKLRFEGAGIGLPGNASACLAHLGLKEEMMKISHHVTNLTDKNVKNEELGKTSLVEGFPLNQNPFLMLSREGLITFLASKLDKKIEFGKEIIGIQFQDNMAKVQFNDKTEESFDMVIDAEGIHSPLRTKLIPELVQENDIKDLGYNVWRFIADNYKLENPIFYSGNQTAFSTFPIGENKVYCYAHLMDQKKFGVVDRKEIYLLFLEHPEHIRFLINSVKEEDFLFSRHLILTKPRFSYKNVAFVGDAAHATTPFLQQGAAFALEDAIALAEMLNTFPDTQTAIKHYQEFRAPRVNWVREVCANPPAYRPDIANHAQKKVEGWKELLTQDYFHLLKNYIHEHITENSKKFTM